MKKLFFAALLLALPSFSFSEISKSELFEILADEYPALSQLMNLTYENKATYKNWLELHEQIVFEMTRAHATETFSDESQMNGEDLSTKVLSTNFSYLSLEDGGFSDIELTYSYDNKVTQVTEGASEYQADVFYSFRFHIEGDLVAKSSPNTKEYNFNASLSGYFPTSHEDGSPDLESIKQIEMLQKAKVAATGSAKDFLDRLKGPMTEFLKDTQKQSATVTITKKRAHKCKARPSKRPNLGQALSSN